MSKRYSHSSHHHHHHGSKARVKRSKAKVVGLILAAFVTVAALSAFVWLAVEKFDVSGSSDSVAIKKKSSSSQAQTTHITNESRAASSTEATSEQTTAQTTTEATTAQTEATQVSKPAPAQVKISEEAVVADDAVTVKWEKTDGADGYDVYRLSAALYDVQVGDSKTDNKDNTGFDWQLAASIKGADNTVYSDTDIKPEMKYIYKVSAFVMNGGDKLSGKESKSVSAQTPIKADVDYSELYLLSKGTPCYSDKLAVTSYIPKEGYYTGKPDSKQKGYVRINYMFTTRLVKSASAKKVKDAVAIPTGAIGQEGGQIYGSSACGPTTAAIVVKYDKGIEWNKDDLIRYTEKNKLADQGSMMGGVGKGGMSAPMVVKLINSYSKGEVKATNIYKDGMDVAQTLKYLIDHGKHSVLSVRYAWDIVHHPYSIIHFVVPSAYSVEKGKLYFYYVDTAFSNGPAGLRKIEGDEINRSVATVNSEPKCIITVE